MFTFRIVLAYDGTDYIGWQRQAAGTSIQGLLESALREFDDREVAVAGAGRTDAGVHALAQVASFALARSIEPATLVRALNAKLPPDVRVLSAAAADPGFHARFDARGKTYCYRIWNGEVLPPFERRYVWHVPGPLDVERMGRAAALVEGTHDFAAFQASGSDASSTRRTIFTSRMEIASCGNGDCGLGIDSPQSKMICFTIRGDGFLRHMVRSIAGSLVEVGRRRRDPEWIRELIESGDRTQAGRTAPPEGLFLAGVDYVK